MTDALGPLPVGLLTDGEAAAVRAWAEDYAAAEVAKARVDERGKWQRACARVVQMTPAQTGKMMMKANYFSEAVARVQYEVQADDFARLTTKTA